VATLERPFKFGPLICILRAAFITPGHKCSTAIPLQHTWLGLFDFWGGWWVKLTPVCLCLQEFLPPAMCKITNFS